VIDLHIIVGREIRDSLGLPAVSLYIRCPALKDLAAEDPEVRARAAERFRQFVRPRMASALIGDVASASVPSRVNAALALGILASRWGSPELAAKVVPHLLLALQDRLDHVQEAACEALESFAPHEPIAAVAAREFRKRQAAALEQRRYYLDGASPVDALTWTVMPACLAPQRTQDFYDKERKCFVVWPGMTGGPDSADRPLPVTLIGIFEPDTSDPASGRNQEPTGERFGIPVPQTDPFLVKAFEPAAEHAEAIGGMMRFYRNLQNCVANRINYLLRFATQEDERLAQAILSRQTPLFLVPNAADASVTVETAVVTVALRHWTDSPDYLAWRGMEPDPAPENEPEEGSGTSGMVAPEYQAFHHALDVGIWHAGRQPPSRGELLIYNSCDGYEDTMGIVHLQDPLPEAPEAGNLPARRRFRATIYAFGEERRLRPGAVLRRTLSWSQHEVCYGRKYGNRSMTRIRFPWTASAEMALVEQIVV